MSDSPSEATYRLDECSLASELAFIYRRGTVKQADLDWLACGDGQTDYDCQSWPSRSRDMSHHQHLDQLALHTILGRLLR
jgi:hypothetical protein